MDQIFSAFFFTVVLSDRESSLLVGAIDRLRRSYRAVQRKMPFEMPSVLARTYCGMTKSVC